MPNPKEIINDAYRDGFRDGWRAASRVDPFSQPNTRMPKLAGRKKRKQSGKAKILTAMTAPAWKKYKKGSGRKTYVQIRAQVSRSQAYKRKVKNL